MDEYIIRTENLGFAYDDKCDDSLPVCEPTPVLFGVNLSVRAGEYISVLGHNGSGKSTLAKLLNLILTPTEGKIFIKGVDVTSNDFSEDDLYDVRRKVGMVFQNPDNQLVATVVEEDVAFGPENLGLSREEIRRRVDDALEKVGMTEYKKHAPHKLSGGQKQRIAIAGIIAMKPDVIIFDEATAMLDPKGRSEVMQIMERLNKDEGITVINITHYMEEAARADRVIVINDGRMLLDGTPDNVFSQIELLHKIGLEAPHGQELLYLLKNDGLADLSPSVSESACIDTLIGYLKK